MHVGWVDEGRRSFVADSIHHHLLAPYRLVTSPALLVLFPVVMPLSRCDATVCVCPIAAAEALSVCGLHRLAIQLYQETRWSRV